MKFLRIFREKPPEPISEAEQLRAYRLAGDPALVGALYEPYMEMVYLICFKYLRAEEESKDAVMQIFEKLLTDLQVHEVLHFKSWLHTVTRNHCLMQLRKSRVFSEVGLPDEELQIGIDQIMEDEPDFPGGQIDLLQDCLQSLAPSQRTVIELFYMQEKCYKEIAGETGFDPGKVKSYIQNGKRNLKICIDKNGSY